MWLLSFLPEYFFHLLTLLGFVGALACLFPIPYKTIVQVISIAVIAFSLYIEGGISNEEEWKFYALKIFIVDESQLLVWLKKYKL